MKAVVWHDLGDIRLDNVSDPTVHDPQDAILRLTASAICGTDLHFIRGTMSGMKPGTILGHEGVGVVESLGKKVRNFNAGDRVVVPSTIGCGCCSYCRDGYYAQCDVANPNGPTAGTAFFGGPKDTGPFQGLQAQYARVPFANVGLVKIPENVSDDQAIMISDIWPTGYFGAKLAEIKDGDTVAVFGCGPVGQFAILSAKLLGAGRVFAVDHKPDRLAMARAQGAETIHFDEENPVEVLRELTGGSGPDRVIDAVGIDSEPATAGPAAKESASQAPEFARQLAQVAPRTDPDGGNWHPGGAPSQTLQWAVQSVAKAGTVSIIGVYPPQAMAYPIGLAMNKNLTVNAGNANHRRYIPTLLNLVAAGVVDPLKVLTQREPMTDAITAYKQFDQRKPGWIKVVLEPAAAAPA